MSDTRGAHAPGGVAEARAALLGWVDEAGPAGRSFLQTHLLGVAPDRYRLRHAADADLPAADLTAELDPYAARVIAQTTADREYRPLRTAPTLRRGWTFEALDGPGLWTALDYLYPACAAHWHAARRGSLRVTHWSETAGRQTGMYAAVGLLPEPALRDTARACCGDRVCLRQVAWGTAPDHPAPLPTDLEAALGAVSPKPGDARVPCPEACSLFISLARTLLSVERSPPVEVPGLGELRADEIAQLRALADAAAAGTLDSARAGDFDLPTNTRRLRYLAAKLQLRITNYE